MPIDVETSQGSSRGGSKAYAFGGESRQGSKASAKATGLSGLPPVFTSKRDSDAFSVGGASSGPGTSRFGSKDSMHQKAAVGQGPGDRQVAQAASKAGWKKRPPLELIEELGKPPLAMEPNSALELNTFAMNQLNQMYAYMEQAMARERVRHSSDVHLLMRKVDRDLRDTFRTVRDTFMSLTGQVQGLLQEVDAGKRSIASIQNKFDAAKNSAAVRAQYVEELEAVLDGQVPNISEAMRKLSEDLTNARIHVEKMNKEAAEKDEQMAQERADLKAVIKSLGERLNERDVQGFAGATELPLLPEMSATWTLREGRPQTRDSLSPADASPSSARQQRSSDSAANGTSAPDVLTATMAHSDAMRAVTRFKAVKPSGTRPSTTPAFGQVKTPRTMTRAQQQALQAKLAEYKKRAEEAEERLAKQQKLFLDAAPSMQLLREVFNELRQTWRLRSPDSDDDHKDVEVLRAELEQKNKAPEILDAITSLFVDSFPDLGNFSVVLEAICDEASKPAPQLYDVVSRFESGTCSPVTSGIGSSFHSAAPTPDMSPSATKDAHILPTEAAPSSGGGEEQILRRKANILPSVLPDASILLQLPVR